MSPVPSGPRPPDELPQPRTPYAFSANALRGVMMSEVFALTEALEKAWPDMFEGHLAPRFARTIEALHEAGWRLTSEPPLTSGRLYDALAETAKRAPNSARGDKLRSRAAKITQLYLDLHDRLSNATGRPAWGMKPEETTGDAIRRELHDAHIRNCPICFDEDVLGTHDT